MKMQHHQTLKDFRMWIKIKQDREMGILQESETHSSLDHFSVPPYILTFILLPFPSTLTPSFKSPSGIRSQYSGHNK